MAKIILTKREKELWLQGKAETPIGKEREGIIPAIIGISPRNATHQEFREAVKNTIWTLAGQLGGHGIELVDEEGNDLSDPHDTYGDMTFNYADPFQEYHAVLGSQMISVDKLKPS